MSDVWLGLTLIKNITPIELRLYSERRESICMEFLPCSNRIAPRWEEWHNYKFPLIVYFTDYRKLLITHLERAFPIVNPVTGHNQETFNEYFDNWIPQNAWNEIIASIKSDWAMYSKGECAFFESFLFWLNRALLETELIVVDGNL